ncbi:MAG TPA: hypothetical protein VJT31_28600 [Rugosimonospora sp.]|nr:hypothetical protein [Rugosimonospora sp.]
MLGAIGKSGWIPSVTYPSLKTAVQAAQCPPERAHIARRDALAHEMYDTLSRAKSIETELAEIDAHPVDVAAWHAQQARPRRRPTTPETSRTRRTS